MVLFGAVGVQMKEAVRSVELQAALYCGKELLSLLDVVSILRIAAFLAAELQEHTYVQRWLLLVSRMQHHQALRWRRSAMHSCCRRMTHGATNAMRSS
mmetsp:Transcript_8310/g.9400  ORF Transcript_8310/g.9400 Transcript_8310/m.9400 type:complete len:98 (+) Transcript_8310:328-621(+)